MSSRSGGALAAGPTTGPTALSLTRVKRPAAGTPADTTTPAPSAPISGEGTAHVAITANSLTEFSSVGSTRRGTEPRLAKMGRIVSERFVSSLIRLSNLEFYHLIIVTKIRRIRKRILRVCVIVTIVVSTATLSMLRPLLH